MIARKEYPAVTCSTHPLTFLVDVIGNSGELVRACPDCMPLVLKDVVRQLFEANPTKPGGKHG